MRHEKASLGCSKGLRSGDVSGEGDMQGSGPSSVVESGDGGSGDASWGDKGQSVFSGQWSVVEGVTEVRLLEERRRVLIDEGYAPGSSRDGMLSVRDAGNLGQG